MKLGSTRNRYSGAVVCDIQRRLTARAGGYVPGSALRVTVTLTLLPSASLQAASPKLTVTAEPLGGTAIVTPDYSHSANTATVLLLIRTKSPLKCHYSLINSDPSQA